MLYCKTFDCKSLCNKWLIIKWGVIRNDCDSVCMADILINVISSPNSMKILLPLSLVWCGGHTCNRLRINYQFNPESNSWMWCWWQHFDHETFLQNSVLCHSVLPTPHVSNSAPAASERAKIEWHSKQSAVLRPFTPAKTNNFFMYVFNLTTNCGQRELKQLKCSGDDSYLLSICVWPEKHAYIMQKLEGR